MKIIYSNYLPFNRFKAINLFGTVFARRQYFPLDKRAINHEYIHTRQMFELFIVGFYIWYILEWLYKLIIYKDRLMAYKKISFEKEAYINDINLDYLRERKLFSFIKYL
jgi:hypothetical protein